jgi:hypothetical protein
MKSIRIKQVVYAACIRDIRNEYKILVENLKRRDHLGDLGINGMIILKLILTV